MESIIQQLTDWLKGVLVSEIMDNLTNTFSSVNDQVGQIHAIISNIGNKEYKIKMGQLVIMPVLIPDFTFENWKERGTGAFGSTGR